MMGEIELPNWMLAIVAMGLLCLVMVAASHLRPKG